MTSSVNVTNPQFPADLVTFTEEILNGKLHFLCSVSFTFLLTKSKSTSLENFQSSDAASHCNLMNEFLLHFVGQNVTYELTLIDFSFTEVQLNTDYVLTLYFIMLKNGQLSLKILWCSHRKIFKVCSTIFQHYEIKS